jgi:hypothetical protein
MAVARAAEHAARAAFFESLGIKPFFHSLEPESFFALIRHKQTSSYKNTLGINLIAGNGARQ